MEERTRLRLVNSDIWVRAVYMVLFSIAYSIAKVVIVFLVVFQFLAVLFTGVVNAPLLQFGKNLSVYIYEILEFQTFNTELRPFPFAPWPEEEPGGDLWLEEEDVYPDSADEDVSETAAEVDDAEEGEQSSTDTDADKK